MASDSQAMGRIGEVICRTWQTAHSMKAQRGALSEDSAHNDNFRIRRYIAKYTINTPRRWYMPSQPTSELFITHFRYDVFT